MDGSCVPESNELILDNFLAWQAYKPYMDSHVATHWDTTNKATQNGSSKLDTLCKTFT
jgi:hypothetical protein